MNIALLSHLLIAQTYDLIPACNLVIQALTATGGPIIMSSHIE